MSSCEHGDRRWPPTCSARSTSARRSPRGAPAHLRGVPRGGRAAADGRRRAAAGRPAGRAAAAAQGPDHAVVESRPSCCTRPARRRPPARAAHAAALVPARRCRSPALAAAALAVGIAAGVLLRDRRRVDADGRRAGRHARAPSATVSITGDHAELEVSGMRNPPPRPRLPGVAPARERRAAADRRAVHASTCAAHGDVEVPGSIEGVDTDHGHAASRRAARSDAHQARRSSTAAV